MPCLRSLAPKTTNIRAAIAIVIEEMERRVLLSSSVVPATWSAQFAAPAGAQYSGTPVMTEDPQNGDLIVANNGNATSNPDDPDMIVSAYKPDGSGGWELDTTFGGKTMTQASPAALQATKS
jgi:hypothetical protein